MRLADATMCLLLLKERKFILTDLNSELLTSYPVIRTDIWVTSVTIKIKNKKKTGSSNQIAEQNHMVV